MSHLVTVSPVNDLWVVRSPGLPQEMPFRSGGQAESAARRLAAAAAQAGVPAALEIYLRDGSLAGRVEYPARAAA